MRARVPLPHHHVPTTPRPNPPADATLVFYGAEKPRHAVRARPRPRVKTL